MAAEILKNRVQELQKYIPILNTFIEKLNGDPTKEIHLKSVRGLKDLIVENRVTEANIDKCEDLLLKLSEKNKKEIQESTEREFQKRMDSIVERYTPFLENCISKLEKYNQNGYKDAQLKTIRYLLQILQNRRLTFDNIDICEERLRQLDQKVEQNTIEKIKQRVEASSKKNKILTKSDKIKCTEIPIIDGIVIDHTKLEKRIHTDLITSGIDPRRNNTKYIERFKTSDKSVLLTVVSYSDEQSAQLTEARLALKYKTKKKDVQQPVDVPKPTESLPTNLLDTDMLLNLQDTVQPSMVPPPQTPFINTTPTYNQTSPIVPPTPLYCQEPSPNVYDPISAFNSVEPTQTFAQNAPTATAMSSRIGVSSADPRLRNRTSTSSLEPAVPSRVDQVPYNSYGMNYQNAYQNGHMPAYTTTSVSSHDSSLYNTNKPLYDTTNQSFRDKESYNVQRDNVTVYGYRRDRSDSEKRSAYAKEYKPRDYDNNKKSNKDAEIGNRDREYEINKYSRDRGNELNREKGSNRTSYYDEKSISNKKYENTEKGKTPGPVSNFKIPKLGRSSEDDKASDNKNQSTTKRPSLNNDEDELWDEDCTSKPTSSSTNKQFEKNSKEMSSKIQNSGDPQSSKNNQNKRSKKNISNLNKPSTSKATHDDELWEEDEAPSKKIKLEKDKSLTQKQISHKNNKEKSRSKSPEKIKTSLSSKEKCKDNLSKKNEKPDAGEDLLLALSKMYGADKLEKIKSILNESKPAATENKPEENKKSEKLNENEEPIKKSSKKKGVKRQKIISSDEEEPENVQPKKAKKSKQKLEIIEDLKKPPEVKVSPTKGKTANKKKKSELDKLNEDIDNMFIRDGVLQAVGRRQVGNTEDIKAKEQTKVQPGNYEEMYYGIVVKKCSVALERLNSEKPLASGTIKKSEIKLETALIKNIDFRYHLQSPKAKQCCLCGSYTGTEIVEHYMKEHPGNEIFSSRVNPIIAEAIRQNPNAKDGVLVSPNQVKYSKIKAKCKFCLKENTLKRKDWKMHFMMHTGEFKCKNCNVPHPYPHDSKTFYDKYPHEKNSCKKKKFTTDDSYFHAGGLNAFMCQVCNFVQINRINVEDHVNKQHGDPDIDVLRFDIVGFSIPTDDDMPSLELQDVIINKLAASEHNYAEAKPLVIKKEVTDNLPKEESELIESKKPIIKTEADSTTEKNKFSALMNAKNQLKVWSSKVCNKSQELILKMLEVECLYSLYKCMEPVCCFYTNDKKLMQTHLLEHSESTFECSYCDTFYDSDGLANHITDVHQSSVYQCPYCFYRSGAAYNVTVHQNHYHRNSQNKILLCEGRPALLVNELDSIYASRAKYVQPLCCTICDEKIFLINSFESHINTHEEEVLKCQACSVNVLKENMVKHLLTHRMGLYECVYCFYGTNHLDSIRLHMSTIHPAKLLYVAVRFYRNTNEKPHDPTKVEATVLAHIGVNVEKDTFIRQKNSSQKDEPLAVKSETASTAPSSTTNSIVALSSSKQSPSASTGLPIITKVYSFGDNKASSSSNNTSLTVSQPKTTLPSNTTIILPKNTKLKPGTKVIIQKMGGSPLKSTVSGNVINTQVLKISSTASDQIKPAPICLASTRSEAAPTTLTTTTLAETTTTTQSNPDTSTATKIEDKLLLPVKKEPM